MNKKKKINVRYYNVRIVLFGSRAGCDIEIVI